jgi:hypothetical protein
MPSAIATRLLKTLLLITVWSLLARDLAREMALANPV